MAIRYKGDFASCPRGHTKVRIDYGIVRNTNKTRGGYCPVYRVSGTGRSWDGGLGRRWHGDTFCRGIESRESAVAQARAMAQDAGDRYLGDWCVVTRRVHKVRGKGL